MAPPDPFNEAAFLDFLDRRRAAVMTPEQVRAEEAHWARWLRDAGLVAEAPRPRGAGSRALVTAVGAAGGATAVVGMGGWVVDAAGVASPTLVFVNSAATIGGFLAWLAAIIAGGAVNRALEAERRAGELVEMRLDELAGRARAGLSP